MATISTAYLEVVDDLLWAVMVEIKHGPPPWLCYSSPSLQRERERLRQIPLQQWLNSNQYCPIEVVADLVEAVVARIRPPPHLFVLLQSQWQFS
ncbi:hypothetical protein CRG98_000188 [Punica granatum]|uniref:Uncharacterized protein n=1 Tax=Punica granatum TaxID=22663 RepID=A0A2I0LFJ0_PUNGR|nr:hypothetical protein CRG98_000188 [Punica granatum]